MKLVPDRSIIVTLCNAAIRTQALFLQELLELINPANSAAGLAAAFALGTLLSFIPLPVLDSMMVGVVLARHSSLRQ
jgi:hypothetical protein